MVLGSYVPCSGPIASVSLLIGLTQLFQNSAISLIIVPGPGLNFSIDLTVRLRVVYKCRIHFIYRPYAGYLDTTMTQRPPFPNTAIT